MPATLPLDFARIKIRKRTNFREATSNGSIAHTRTKSGRIQVLFRILGNSLIKSVECGDLWQSVSANQKYQGSSEARLKKPESWKL